MEKLIIKFLDRHVDLIIENGIHLRDDSSNKNLSYQDLVNLIVKIFSLGRDDGAFSDLIRKWYNARLENVIGGLYKFLENCTIELGPTNWEVRHSLYGKINLDDVAVFPIDSPLKNYEEEITRIVDDWFQEKVIEISEKNMKNNIW